MLKMIHLQQTDANFKAAIPTSDWSKRYNACNKPTADLNAWRERKRAERTRFRDIYGNEEEDTCMSYEEEDTCMSKEGGTHPV